MLNDAAKKLVARAARVEAKERHGQIAFGANIDQLTEDAWMVAQQLNPDFRTWLSAKSYFETVFQSEIERD